MNWKKAHLTLDKGEPVDGYKTESTLVHGLKNTRLITARDQETGLPVATAEYGRLGNWLGAIGYMAILDQIGSCYRPDGTKKITKYSPNQSMKKALAYFTDIGSDKIDALWSLRNAFMHDLSLINSNEKNLHQLSIIPSQLYFPRYL